MKILIYGDSTSVLWHPLEGMKPWAESLRTAGHEVTMSEAYPEVTLELLSQYDVCVCYIDNWANRGSQQAADIFCQYVAEGGKMLSIHNGIIVKSAENFLDMQGGSFHHHPEAEEIRFFGEEKGAGEILLKDFETFAIKEEPYMFDMRATEKNIYLWYEYRGEAYPAAWTIQYGKGQLVYIAAGHEARVVSHPMVQQLYNNGLAYLIRA